MLHIVSPLRENPFIGHQGTQECRGYLCLMIWQIVGKQELADTPGLVCVAIQLPQVDTFEAAR